MYLNVVHQQNISWTSQPRETLGSACGIHDLGGQPTVRSVMLLGVIDIFAFFHASTLYIRNYRASKWNKVLPHGLRWIPLNHERQWWNRRRHEAHKVWSFQDLGNLNKTLHKCSVFGLNSKNKLSEFICGQETHFFLPIYNRFY